MRVVAEGLRAEDEALRQHFRFRELVDKPVLCSAGLGYDGLLDLKYAA